MLSETAARNKQKIIEREESIFFEDQEISRVCGTDLVVASSSRRTTGTFGFFKDSVFCCRLENCYLFFQNWSMSWYKALYEKLKEWSHLHKIHCFVIYEGKVMADFRRNSLWHSFYFGIQRKIKYKLLLLISYSQGKNYISHTFLNTHGKNRLQCN